MSPSWAMAQLGLIPPCRFLAMLCEAAACQTARYVSIAAYATDGTQRPHADACRG